eukprot:m.118414 g.118414  ORF g.118414 m.118414 type:complete len:555 (+) comp16430_c1_seq4:236-1900(+)
MWAGCNVWSLAICASAVASCAIALRKSMHSRKISLSTFFPNRTFELRFLNPLRILTGQSVRGAMTALVPERGARSAFSASPSSEFLGLAVSRGFWALSVHTTQEGVCEQRTRKRRRPFRLCVPSVAATMPSKKATPFGAVAADGQTSTDEATLAQQIKRVREVHSTVSKENCQKALASCGYDVERAIQELLDGNVLDEWSSAGTKSKPKKKKKQSKQQEEQQQKQEDEARQQKERDQQERKKQAERRELRKKQTEAKAKAKATDASDAPKPKPKDVGPSLVEREVSTLKAAGVQQVSNSGMRKLTVDQVMNQAPVGGMPKAAPVPQPVAFPQPTLFASPPVDVAPAQAGLSSAAQLGMSQAAITLSQLERSMASKWREAQMQSQHAFAQLREALVAREQLINHEMEALYTREAHLLRQRQAWLSEVAKGLASAPPEQAQAHKPFDSFNNYLQADLPAWDVSRFVGDSAALSKAIGGFGQVQHAPFEKPTDATAMPVSLAPGQGRPRKSAPAGGQQQARGNGQPQVAGNGSNADGALPKREPKKRRNRKPKATAQ